MPCLDGGSSGGGGLFPSLPPSRSGGIANKMQGSQIIVITIAVIGRMCHFSALLRNRRGKGKENGLCQGFDSSLFEIRFGASDGSTMTSRSATLSLKDSYAP